MFYLIILTQASSQGCKIRTVCVCVCLSARLFLHSRINNLRNWRKDACTKCTYGLTFPGMPKVNDVGERISA